MAESPSVLAPSPIDEESLARAEKFTLEPFVQEGEDAAASADVEDGLVRNVGMHEGEHELGGGMGEVAKAGAGKEAEGVGRIIGREGDVGFAVMEVLGEGKTRLLPWVPAVVKQVDLSEKKVRVDWAADW